MAIYETRESSAGAKVLGNGGAGSVISRTVSVAMTTAMVDNANDEVGLLWVPKGAVFVDAVLSATDMDTGGPTLTIDVGDDGDEDRIFAASTVGQAGTLSNAWAASAHGYKWTADTKIKAYIKAAATTPAAGTLKFTISYFVDDGFDPTNPVV